MSQTVMRYGSKFRSKAANARQNARANALLLAAIAHHKPAAIRLAAVSIQSNRRYDKDESNG